jgi:hypothetical protein
VEARWYARFQDHITRDFSAPPPLDNTPLLVRLRLRPLVGVSVRCAVASAHRALDGALQTPDRTELLPDLKDTVDYELVPKAAWDKVRGAMPYAWRARCAAGARRRDSGAVASGSAATPTPVSLYAVLPRRSPSSQLVEWFGCEASVAIEREVVQARGLTIRVDVYPLRIKVAFFPEIAATTHEVRLFRMATGFDLLRQAYLLYVAVHHAEDGGVAALYDFKLRVIDDSVVPGVTVSMVTNHTTTLHALKMTVSCGSPMVFSDSGACASGCCGDVIVPRARRVCALHVSVSACLCACVHACDGAVVMVPAERHRRTAVPRQRRPDAAAAAQAADRRPRLRRVFRGHRAVRRCRVEAAGEWRRQG